MNSESASLIWFKDWRNIRSWCSRYWIWRQYGGYTATCLLINWNIVMMIWLTPLFRILYFKCNRKQRKRVTSAQSALRGPVVGEKVTCFSACAVGSFFWCSVVPNNLRCRTLRRPALVARYVSSILSILCVSPTYSIGVFLVRKSRTH